LKGPVELGLRVPSNVIGVRLVYEQLGSSNGIHVLPVSALGREVRAVIPAEHTTEPGLRYWWEIDLPSGNLKTDVTIIHFFDDPYGLLSNPGDQVAHDMQRNKGKLPSGGYIPSGHGRLPHGLTPSSAWVSSKTLEVRNIGGSIIHDGLDFAMANGNNVLAMEAGIPNSTTTLSICTSAKG